MKIVVVNGSPRAKGNTEMLAEAFLRCAREAGHEGSLINLREKKIAGCLGCQYCFSHDGVCAQKMAWKTFWRSLTERICWCSPRRFTGSMSLRRPRP